MLNYAWKGGNLDWIRDGADKPGSAQRFQYREKPGARMKAGGEYWYTATFMLPSSVRSVSGYTLSTMDFKHHVNGHGSVPSVSFNFEHGYFSIVESIDSRWKCGSFRNVDGGQTAACDRTENVGRIGRQRDYSNRWVQMVAHLRWSGDKGFVKIWVDGKPIFGFSGNTMQWGRQVEFKFGPYRHHMTGNPGNTTLYFSAVAKAKDCQGLGIGNCAVLASNPPKGGFQNVIGRDRWVANDFSSHK